MSHIPLKRELEPCPFCGNDRNIAMANEKHDHSGGYFIACPACEASTGLRYATGEDPRPLLVEQWNRRAVRGYLASTPDGGFDDHDEVMGDWSLVGEVVSRGSLGGTHAQVRNGLPVGTKLYTVAEEAAPTYAEMLEAGVDAADTLKAIGARIGYGRAQQILGEEWDLRHGCAPRGRMGVTAKDDEEDDYGVH